MGIVTTVSCDECGKVIDRGDGGDDYVTIYFKFELDRNFSKGNDERESALGVYCEEHGRELWADIKELVK